MRYTKEEIDQMGDKEAYRRYFAAVNLLTQMAGGGSTGATATALGGGPPPQQARSRRSSSFRSSTPTSAPGRSTAQDTAESTYNFPR